MKANCLTRALDQWMDNPELRLWYNSNHVISLEPEYEGHDLVIMKSYPVLDYLELNKFGYDYFVRSFSLTLKYKKILKEYLNN